MKRLVKNGKIILDGTDPLYAKEEQALRKLEELENIEEELGIDLITLFKAFKKGIWFKYNLGSRTYNWKTGEDKETGDQIVFVKAPYKTLAENIAYFRRLFEKEYAQNYGKTWALTREELK
jgi:hypothetical protein